MKFEVSDEQLMLRDAAARFVKDAYGFEHRRQLLKTDDGFSREYWQQYADLGWLGLNLSEDVGGLACSSVETIILMEQFGRGMVLEPILSTVVLCAGLIDRSGNTLQREALLPGVITGERMLALAHDEPGARGAPIRLATQARKTPNGYVIDGRKTVVLGAASADQLIVSAQLDGDVGLALFVCDRSMAGVTVQGYSLVDGSRAGDVHFTDVQLPEIALLASGPDAVQQLDEAHDRTKLAAMAQALGAMEACLMVTSDYLKGRVQFKQPLAKFQSLQHLMADMFVDTQESRSLLYRGLALIDAEPPVRSKAVAVTKIFIGPAGRRVSASGIQLHGGYGTTDEYIISHYFRYLFVMEKLLGDADDHNRAYALD